MRYLIVLILLLPATAMAQRFSFGIQSNAGVTQARLLENNSGFEVEPQPGFTTGGDLFVQADIVGPLALRLHLGGVYQSLQTLFQETRGNQGFTGLGRWDIQDVGQVAASLQAIARIPLTNSRRTFLEPFLGAGVRGVGGSSSCSGGGFSSQWDQEDTVATVFWDRSQQLNQGMKLELHGGLRLSQLVSAPDRRPIWLTAGIGLRGTLAPMAVFQTVFGETEAPLIEGFGGNRRPDWDGVLFGTSCQEVFNTNEISYQIENFGQQAELQFSIRFGLGKVGA